MHIKETKKQETKQLFIQISTKFLHLKTQNSLQNYFSMTKIAFMFALFNDRPFSVLYFFAFDSF